MSNLVCYKVLPEWQFETLPRSFREQHNTRAGTWAKLEILSGRLKYEALDADGNVEESVIFDQHSETPYVEPQAWHRVEPLDRDLRCQLSFFCRPQDYYAKKYGLTAPHSEVIEAAQYIPAGKVLDMGCGQGRNTLYLQQRGFEVTAFDRNEKSVDTLTTIIQDEHLSHIRAFVDDIGHVDLSEQFDWVLSTVVLMFLEKSQIAHAIKTMQTCTVPGGYNLIVCAVDSPDYPLPDDFLSFGFKPNELAEYYQGWDFKKYNEDVGHLHRRDASGNRIALRFVTMVAQKPGVKL
ncbi:tellurite resistance methyltransferase TehB [Terasakiispira papahanaumokuakeensis]|uniref:Tellurite resistance methyltransferase TehB n=1 Tax=Terasakiispira papahanaumokuakeensis TaxID=197479 RepID=A0A1E2VEP2_9GAMM|nr:SAM-dependent methyltransferase TehB [Terasakiispira papahanaumokuakeensis]ODC05322.1 tellurite resistance methyltransferase TehB [Terasakiispira papahanaumokuakeensis]